MESTHISSIEFETSFIFETNYFLFVVYFLLFKVLMKVVNVYLGHSTAN